MDWNAELYSSICNVQQTSIKEVLNMIHLHADSYPEVMDLGCGTGEVTKLLLNIIPNVGHMTAYDKSQNMIDFAIRNNPDIRITYTVADADDPDTMKEEWKDHFDLIVSNYSIHWITDHLAALKIMSSQLKPGGEIVLCTLTDFAEPFGDVVDTLLKSPKWENYLKRFRPNWHDSVSWLNTRWLLSSEPIEEFRKYLKESDFEILKCDATRVEYIFETDKECIGTFLLFVPPVSAIPEDRLDEFLDDLLNIYEGFRPRNGDGKLCGKLFEIAVHAVKPNK